eukprot:GHVS01020730.1.p1 GENE.GHVS01020730.1~~GHVS01020730.1.p1  ORF type:complete len:377 (-),score=79.38 GHVS01020730.1:100-1230(-)
MDYTEVYSPPSSPHLYGRRHFAWIVLAVLLATFVAFALTPAGYIAGLIVLLAAAPAALLLWGLRWRYEKCISVDLMAEMATRGFFMSAAVAIILELIGTLLARLEVPNCIPKGGDFRLFRPSLKCDMVVVIFFVLFVGLAEEFAKVLPLCKVKGSAQQLPSSCLVLFRVVTTPLGLCLAGCATGAGYAVVETCTYARISMKLYPAILTVFLRGVVCLPFHVACTGYAAGALSFFRYGEGSCSSAWLRSLAVPAVVHGSYDSALTLMEAYSRQPLIQQIRGIVEAVWSAIGNASGAGGSAGSGAGGSDGSGGGSGAGSGGGGSGGVTGPWLVSTLFLVSAIICWILMVVLFFRKFKEVKRFTQMLEDEGDPSELLST